MRPNDPGSVPKIVALVPMRHSSERVPGKNYRPFAGRPLYRHIVGTLSACPLISQIVIDTDSPVIQKDAAEHFPQVLLLERPDHLTAGTVAMNDILLHDVSMIKADYFLQTHSTNPLLRAATITRAIQTYLEIYPKYDSLFSVNRVAVRLWDAHGNPINHDPAMLLRTQDLPPVYEENSCLYIFSRVLIEKRKNRIGARPFMFEINRLEACDIDEESDFCIAEFLYQKYFSEKGVC